MTDLLGDLQQAAQEADRASCALCRYINTLEDGATRAALIDAAAGTIGRDKLAAILKKHETGIGARTVVRHRSEGHTP